MNLEIKQTILQKIKDYQRIIIFRHKRPDGDAVGSTMGLEGINMAVTLFSAYSRRFLLGVACGRESAREGGIPTVWRMGNYSFMLYLLMFVGLHHLLFFLLEGLSWGLLPFVLIRFVLSSLITICFTWLLSHLFVSKI